MMKKCLVFLTTAVLACCLTSCSSNEDILNGGHENVVNMLEDPKPVKLTEAQKVFASDNNQFALNFLKTVNETDRSGKSFIYSPLSITYVLGMVNDAAIGATEQELEQTLGFHEGGIQAVNDYCKNLIDNLPKVDSKVKLNIANAIFLNREYTLNEQFKKDMEQYYDAKAEALDFSASKTLSHINGWCKDKTNGMIPEILDKVDPKMVSYLLNAIYFKADWTSKFDKKNTKTETFTTENGKRQLSLMHQDVLINYLQNDTYSAVIIPYGNGMWSMTVMLPEEGKTTDDIIDELAKSGWPVDNYNHPMNMASPCEVDLKLPSFETTSDTDVLKDGLIGLMRKMGIQLAFDSVFAEIPNMTNRSVYINVMRQKAAIKVNEEGAEAAAVTVAGMANCTSAGQPRKATFHANRPFVYVIREASSGVLLFVGKFTGE